MAYLPDEDDQFVFIETKDQLQVHVRQDPIKINLLEHDAQEAMSSDIPLN